nr:DUF3823 domain-containing protein [uncultured Draconibacterium sp.]
MKKILYFLSTIISIILIVSCEIDNYPAPNATFYGAIRDVEGGGLVEQDLESGSKIGVYEQGYETPLLQEWYIMENGEFRNNLVYAGTYYVEFQSCNFFPFNVDGLVIEAEDNEHDFTVTPYIRIKNLSITHDSGTNKIVATFNLEAGKNTVKVKEINLFAFTDMHVGQYISFEIESGNGQPSQSFNPSSEINPATQYTLSIDLTANSNLFDVSRNYYFRVGAMADQGGVGTIRANYAPYVKIAL